MASLYPNPVKLRWRLWSREVFGADYRAKCFWGAFVIALIGYAAQSLTNVPRYVGLSIKWPAITVAAVAFVWSNVAAFSRAVEHAELKEGELAGLILKIAKRKVTAHVSPGDVFYGGEGYRSVVVQLELVVKNKDGMNEASIELESCRTNVSQDEPDELKFMKQICTLTIRSTMMKSADTSQRAELPRSTLWLYIDFRQHTLRSIPMGLRASLHTGHDHARNSQSTFQLVSYPSRPRLA